MAKRMVYKVTLLVVDHDAIGQQEVIDVLEHNRYPNHCMSPVVMQVDSHLVEWSDGHPLNSEATQESAFKELFKS